MGLPSSAYTKATTQGRPNVFYVPGDRAHVVQHRERGFAGWGKSAIPQKWD